MHVVIVGGGIAGLSTAVACVQAGHRVTILESRSFCGGRAYSFQEPKIGTMIDNGQHLLMGCYTATFAYLSEIGSRDFVTVHPRFEATFASVGGALTSLRCPALRAPWHLLVGLCRWDGLQLREIWRVATAMRRWMRNPSYAAWDGLTVAQWLDAIGQGPRARRLFWEPLSFAVLNESIDRASVAPLLTILQEGLHTRGMPQGLGFPRAPLSRIFVDPAVAYLAKHHGAVRMSTPIAELCCEGHAIAAVRTRQQESITGDAYVLALPPRDLSRLLAASGVALSGAWAQLDRWESAPIISVHLWFDRPVLPASMVGLIDHPFHWAFDTSDLLAESATHCVTLVSSACRNLATWPREQIVQAAQAAMAQYFPNSHAAQLRHVQVTKELHATVSLATGTAAARLPSQTPWRNLFLAGDWTQTYLPATIESAVRSGYTAARAIGCMK